MKNKFRKLAKGRDCQVRVPGVCNFNPETTILAHLGGSGIGQKRDDRHASWSCSDCHDAIDLRTHCEWSQDKLELWHHHGMVRTQEILIAEGHIK